MKNVSTIDSNTNMDNNLNMKVNVNVTKSLFFKNGENRYFSSNLNQFS